MSLRTRVALIAAAAVAVSVLAVSVGAYLATARTLHSGVDASLLDQAEQLLGRGGRPRMGPRPGPLGGPGVFVQALQADGTLAGRRGDVSLPVTEQAARIAAGQEGAAFQTVAVGEESVRVLTVPAVFGGALQIGRPITEIEQVLARLRARMALGGLGGVLLAALLGMGVARRAVEPVHDLTELAEEVAATQDLSRRIDAAGDDELGRLARTFNAMLANLEQARDAQEQLVADASHELRTPLTSLRTNIEVLAHADRLDAAARRDLVGDVVAQLDEFGRLVSGLVELARGARPAGAVTPVRLDELVARVASSARLGPGAPPITVDASPTTVLGEADRLERAVANLLDNAVKYGCGQPVEVTVRDGAVVVRDHGPGIPAEHLPHVFDRFYRAPETRSAPGSGLGLAIVRQVADAHGGTAHAANAADGGAVLSLRLPAKG